MLAFKYGEDEFGLRRFHPENRAYRHTSFPTSQTVSSFIDDSLPICGAVHVAMLRARASIQRCALFRTLCGHTTFGVEWSCFYKLDDLILRFEVGFLQKAPSGEVMRPWADPRRVSIDEASRRCAPPPSIKGRTWYPPQWARYMGLANYGMSRNVEMFEKCRCFF